MVNAVVDTHDCKSVCAMSPMKGGYIKEATNHPRVRSVRRRLRTCGVARLLVLHHHGPRLRVADATHAHLPQRLDELRMADPAAAVRVDVLVRLLDVRELLAQGAGDGLRALGVVVMVANFQSAASDCCEKRCSRRTHHRIDTIHAPLATIRSREQCSTRTHAPSSAIPSPAACQACSAAGPWPAAKRAGLREEHGASSSVNTQLAERPLVTTGRSLWSAHPR